INIQNVHAGGCRLEEVEPADALASLHMANKVRNQVLQIEEEMKRKGESLEVVMVARSGESLKGLKLVKDNLERDLQSYLLELAEISRKAKEESETPPGSRIKA